MEPRSVCWSRRDLLSLETATLSVAPGAGWRLEGTLVMAHAGEPCALAYAVELDGAWRTRAVRVHGRLGLRAVDLALAVDGERRWWLDGEEVQQVAGCVDVDLAFTPSTNLLPIRRLELPVGGEAPVRAAWLRFPELVLEPLDQRYLRTGEREYRYESRGGAFQAALTVDGHGLVTQYGDIWSAEAFS